jgi:hypothetical protein
MAGKKKQNGQSKTGQNSCDRTTGSDNPWQYSQKRKFGTGYPGQDMRDRTIGTSQDIEERAKDSTAFVFDLLWNSSLRFEQCEGTTALPFKSNGRFHFGGRVVTTPPDVFKKLVDNIVPIIKKKGNRPCVIIPPLPRSLFSRCCNDEGHCSNANDEDYQVRLLSGFIKLRNDLIKHLVHSGLEDF